MKIKPKKCRGTGQAKGYGCGEMKLQRTYGLCHDSCYPKWLYSTPEGKEKIERATLKATKDRRELEGMEKEKKSREKLSNVLKSVKNICHKYIRMRDKGKPCAACGIPYKSDFDAGHFFKAELYSSVKFHEDNIHCCCIKCNRMMDGNLSEYVFGIVERIGERRYNQLKQEAEAYKHQNFKWDIEELKEIREYYKQKIRILNKNH